MKKLIFSLLFSIIFSASYGQFDTLGTLFRTSYKVYELQRNNNNGLYRDSKLFTGQDFHPCSVANVGIGLVSLCIADSMGWESNAEDKVLLTLKTITGYTPNVQIDRSPSGFFRHFVNMQTGAQAWNSEYSTIDTGIMVCGAMFCKKYFSQNDSIAKYADILWQSIDWSKTIANPATGRLYMIIDDNGNGLSTSTLPPFNEYMIVAWLAMKAEGNTPGAATQLWNNHFASADSLPSRLYQNIEVLTDHPSSFIPSFTLQFPYYLCHPFTVQADYLQFLKNAQLADSTWFDLATSGEKYEWGLGAGSYPNGSGYHANEINDNSSQVVSPHIIAGFYPIRSQSAEDIKALYRNQKGIYTLPTSAPNKIIWRYSLNNTAWSAPEVQGIDYSTMLFGLASLPQHLGSDFFKRYNNYDFPTSVNTIIEKEPVQPRSFYVYPNPTNDTANTVLINSYKGKFQLRLLDENGVLLSSYHLEKHEDKFEFALSLSWLPSGNYYLEWSSPDFERQTTKFIKL